MQEHDPGKEEHHENGIMRPGGPPHEMLTVLQQSFSHQQQAANVKQQTHRYDHGR